MLCQIGLTFLILFVLPVFRAAPGDQQHTYHFADFSGLMPQNGERQNPRPGLSEGVALRLYEGDTVYVYLCTGRWTNVTFTNLTYSNDGAPENVSLQIDSHDVGQFTTHSLTDWGYYWDSFYGSGYIGHSGLVPPGRHVISVKVASSGDCFGVELGTLTITTSKVMNSATVWCGNKHEMSKSKCLPNVDVTANAVNPVSRTSTATTTPWPPKYIEVTPLSHTSDCVDKQNVKIAFTCDDLTGTQITVKQLESLRMMDKVTIEDSVSSDVRQCKSNMWQLGHVDGDNREFTNIYPGSSLTVNMSSSSDPTKMFPAKILPFVTTKIRLDFHIPKHLRIDQGGSALFVLGLVNLTKDSEIGLQIYNATTDSFTDIHYQTFTSTWKVRGWHLPEFWKSSTKQSFRLHFRSDANVMMFDFLKLDFSLREERKNNFLIAKRGDLKIRGLRYSTSIGPTVVVDDTEIIYNIEDLVIYARKFSRYHVVLRIHYSGVLYPYTTYSVRQADSNQQQQQQRQIVDVSGIMFAKGPPKTREATLELTNKISSIYIDTPTELITINHEDGSSVRLKLTANDDNTQITVLRYGTASNVDGTPTQQTLYFLSTHVNDVVSAVNVITAADLKADITSELVNFSGEYNYTITQTSNSHAFYANNYFNIKFTR